MTIKTDESGNWSYELDKDLEDGEHEVYVAVTDNTGKITSKSKPLAFVKTAQAISVVEAFDDSGKQTTQNPSPIEKSKSRLFMAAVILGLFFVTVAVIIIGFISRKGNKNEGIN